MQRFLNCAALFFDLAPDAREFGRRFVFQCAIGLDLVAEVAQELGEVRELSRQGINFDPLRSHRCWGMEGDFTPLCSAIDNNDYVANVGGLQSDAGNPCLLNQRTDV
ncbi:MAG TPA: hypothetical protein VF214_00685, partial [Edaphobacter sp.]